MTITKSGELASFYTVNKTPIKHLRVYFSPKQAGEGDPSPENVRPIVGWDGVEAYHIGKNIISTNENDWEQGQIMTSGRRTNSTDANYLKRIRTINKYPILPNTQYTLRWFGDIVPAFHQWEKDKTTYISDSGWKTNANKIFTFTSNNNAYWIEFTCRRSDNNTLISPSAVGIEVSIQLEEGSTATPYEPYQGSTTNYEFDVLGKNKLDKNSYKFLNSSIICFGGGASSEPDGSLILKAGTYTFSVSITANMIFATDANKRNIISATNTNTATFTLPESMAVRIGCFIQNATDEEMLAYNYQLELGSVATEYEPYDSNHTVYGGYVDLITGEVVEEWKMIDMGSLNWIERPDLNADFSVSISGKKPGSFNYFCSVYKRPISTSVSNMLDLSILGTPNGSTTYIKDSNYTDKDLFISAVTGQKIIYELATPITHQLSPTQLSAFLGHNNIWSNADRVEIEYDLAESNDILYRRRNVLEKQYPYIITPAANGLINFNTDMIAPLKGCKVYFNPIQEGEGDPSPENVRPISGWTGVRAYHVGQRLIPVDDITNPEANYNVTGNSILVYDSDEGGITMQGTTGATYSQHWYRVIGENAPTTTTSRLFIAKDNITVTLSFDYKHYGLDTVGNTWPIRIGGAETINIRADDAIPWTHFEKTYSLSEGQYISILIYRGVYWRNLQLVTGIQSVENEPYQGQTLPIDWSNSAGTIYGGYVDLVTGELIATYSIVDLGTLTYTHRPDFGNGAAFSTGISTTSLRPKDRWTGICNSYPYLGIYNNFTNVTCGIGFIYNNHIITKDINVTANDASVMKAALNGVMLCYELATPIAYQLTPTQLKTLRGTNNIWSNSNGNIELSYWTH